MIKSQEVLLENINYVLRRQTDILSNMRGENGTKNNKNKINEQHQSVLI